MKTVAKLFVLMTLMSMAAAPLSAQALISAAGGTSATVATTGHAELLGEFIVSVTSGTTAAGTLEVEISPVRLANDDTSGITVDGTGGLAGATILSVFEDQGLILIDFPGGGRCRRHDHSIRHACFRIRSCACGPEGDICSLEQPDSGRPGRSHAIR